MSHGGTVSDPFVLEDGTVSSISMSKNNFAWVANQTGTLYIPWSQTFASVGASGNFLDEEKTRRVESISFYFTLAARSGGSMYYGGLGMTDVFRGYGFRRNGCGNVFGADAAYRGFRLFDGGRDENGGGN